MILILSHKKGKIIIVCSGKQQEYTIQKCLNINVYGTTNFLMINALEKCTIVKKGIRN